jgi:hypothetical protein
MESFRIPSSTGHGFKRNYAMISLSSSGNFWRKCGNYEIFEESMRKEFLFGTLR